MFGLFNKKTKENKVEQKETKDAIFNDLPFDLIFNSNCLPDGNKQDKVYFYKWLKKDGDWVEKGQPLYQIRIGEKNSSSFVNASENLKSERSGILQQFKKIDDLIVNEDKIYTIHPRGKYTLENTPLNESYRFYFDKFKYNVSENHSNQLKIKQWNKQDGDFVNQDETILTLSYGNNETVNHFAEKGGYLEIIRTQLDFFNNQNELIYIIHETDETRIKSKFINISDVKSDDFTGNKIIKWKKVGSDNNAYKYTEGITSKSLDNKVTFTFTLNNIDKNDFIVFQFHSKEIMLTKNDVVSFLFNDSKVINFIINDNSYKISQGLFENKIQIINEELQHFESQQFLKWKIILKKSNREIIGGNDGINQYQSHNNLVTVINKFTKEYRELVRSEILNYKPLLERENLSSSTEIPIAEECYVYLMIDIGNHHHKIGISNKPEWREKTLQSEKPTIELLASKKFVNRKIASSFEKALHETYSNKRIRGEWFQLDLNEIEELKITLNN